MSSLTCLICGEFMGFNQEIFPHKCLPKWSVRFLESDHCVTVYASNKYEAAEKAVEKYEADGADYPCLGGSSEIVDVTGDDGTTAQLSVSGEAVPTYYASDIADPTRADERTTTTPCTYCAAPVPVPEMGAPTEGGPPMCAWCRVVRDDVRDVTVTAKEERG